MRYAADDVRHLISLFDLLVKKLKDAKLFEVAEAEMRALPVIALAPSVAVDRAAWLALAESAERDRDRLAAEMDALAPNPATLTSDRNWNSTPEVQAAFKSVGIELKSTDDDALAAIDHPLASKLRAYRGAAKLAGTYGWSWVEEHGPGGFVLPPWNQLGAESGRKSCSAPNLQQIPRGAGYRKCIVARPGMVPVKADYSQIELRIAATIADEPAMIRAYQEGRDLHTLTASAVTGKPVEEVAKADRQLAKAINFGLLYGMGHKTLAVYARGNYGVELTENQARGYRDAFFRTYPRLKSWHLRVGGHVGNLFRKDPAATHDTRTLLGRRRALPVAAGAADRKFPSVNDALNTPVQGTGADGLKLSLGLLRERRVECPGATPILFAHDEIVVEAPVDRAGAAAEWLKRAMIDGMAPLIAPVPVEVEGTVGPTWGG